MDELSNVERNCRRLIDNAIKERIESEKKFVGKISLQLDNISNEIHKELASKALPSENYLAFYLNEEIPRLREALETEVALRKEIEAKILEQFTDQINDLRDTFDAERKEREVREEEVIAILKNIATRVSDNITKMRREREKNEEVLVQLVEKIIQKLRKETAQLDL
eukprot:TRINITY_DN6809_c0_g1_i1.p1 TRINITY_DN6809_c0_g1~~TRINITY_DN6809_c0_g1_i1.p1  ORF type:complete len:167 (+),score=72.64 TRINITY_DN6809_c0_g1_i1:343-843(+)